MKSSRGFLSILCLLLILVLTINAQIGTPNLSAPINGATYISTSPTLSWWYVASDYSPGPFTFTVEISTSATDFTGSNLVYITSISTYGAGYLTVPSGAGLVVGITYYWRVGIGTTYSAIWSMTPSSGYTDPTGYSLAVSVVGNGTVTKTPDLTSYTTGSTVSLTAVPASGWIFSGWSGDASGNSNPLLVTMNSNKYITATFTLSEYPVLVTPANGTLNVSLNPHFSWNAYTGATSYNLQVSTVNTFATTVIDEDKQASDFDALFYDVTGTGLLPLTQYFWKVTVTTAAGSVTSDIWSFTTKDVLPPGAFSLLFPYNGFNISGINTPFSWEASQNASSYNLIIVDITNPTPDTLINIITTDIQYVVPELPGSSHFQWNVVASNDGIKLDAATSFNFTSGNTYYVATTGNNSNPGTEASPYLSINYAIDNVPPGSLIKVKNGVYYELVEVEIPLTIIGYGSSYPSIVGLRITSSFVNIANFKLLSSNPYGVSIGPFLPISNISLDNIQTVSGSTFTNGFVAYLVDYLTVTNCNFSNNSNIGIELLQCSNVLFDNVIANENLLGMSFYSCSNSTFNYVTAKQNEAIGFALTDNVDLGFNNIKAGLTTDEFNNLLGGIPTQEIGISLGANENISFNGGIIGYNTNFGIYMTQSNFVANPISILGPQMLHELLDITFSGDFEIFRNSFGVFLSSQYSGLEMKNISFLFGSKFIDNWTAEIYLEGNITGTLFDGIELTTSVLGRGFAIGGYGGFPGLQPENIKINNSLFSGYLDQSAISLTNMSSAAINNVDARNNIFLDAVDYNDIERLIYHKVDMNELGLVDFSGSSVSLNPEITVESVNPAYTGATYLLDVYFNPKLEGYVLLTGEFTYDNTKLEYLGYLNDGLINDATWSYFSVSNTVTGGIGELTFAGWGLSTIDEPGKLFTLQMKVRGDATAPGTAAIEGNSFDFTALNTNAIDYTVNVTNGIIDYFAPTGIVADKGDVTLDKQVTMDDFYLLLLYLNGSSNLITDPQALDNADFNDDGVINLTDLNELYAFIIGETPSSVIANGGFNLANAVIMKEEKLVQIPLEIINAEHLFNITVEFEYDPAILNYQSFSSLYKIDGYTVLGYEKQQGISVFTFFSNKELNGTITPGEIYFRINEMSFTETNVKTKYTLNGKETLSGPTLTVSPNGVTEVVDEEMPSIFEVYQNYPNPFNPTTKIKYTVPDAGFVTIKVYNILGQLVNTLVNTEMNSGVYEIVWNGKNNYGSQVSAGVYIYRVTAGKNIAVKKMILIK
ncbi:MAG: T9SS type A sorting domain-containing protein [Melioribacteraceae bacterium]|nr:T9SS type A sorting domain-containing protein [Melioribacteraceae bacterium]